MDQQIYSTVSTAKEEPWTLLIVIRVANPMISINMTVIIYLMTFAKAITLLQLPVKYDLLD